MYRRIQKQQKQTQQVLFMYLYIEMCATHIHMMPIIKGSEANNLRRNGEYMGRVDRNEERKRKYDNFLIKI